MLGHWIAAGCSPSRPISRDLEDRILKPLGAILRNAPHLCRFSAAAESDGTRLEVTPLEAPWSNGKTERAGKDWKEDYYKVTQDGTEAQTWTDVEEDCDSVNQARASKISDSGYSACQRVFGRNPPQKEGAILECGGADPAVVSRQQTQERSMTMRRVALQASPALDHKRRWKLALYHAAKHYQGELHVGQHLWVLATWSECSQESQHMLFGTQAWPSATRCPQFGLRTAVP